MRFLLVSLALALASAGCLGLFEGSDADGPGLRRRCGPELVATRGDAAADHVVRFFAEIRGMPGTLHMCAYDAHGVLRAKAEAPVATGQSYVFQLWTPGPVAVSSSLLTGEGISGGFSINQGAPSLCGDTPTYGHGGSYTMGLRRYEGEGETQDPCGPTGESATLLMGSGPARMPPTALLVAGMGTALVGTALAWNWRQGLYGGPLFTRLQRPRLLDLQARARVHDLVAADPGVRAADVARELEISHGHATYHLRVLVRERLAVGLMVRGRRHYFVTGSLSTDQMRQRAMLRRRDLSLLYDEVLGAPGSSLTEIARRLRWPLTRASRTAGRLEQVGLVRRRPEGRLTRVFPC